MEKGVTAPGNTPKCSINLFDEPNDNRPTPILNCKFLRLIKASCTLFDSLTVFNGTCSKYLYCILQLSSFFINASDEIGKRC